MALSGASLRVSSWTPLLNRWGVRAGNEEAPLNHVGQIMNSEEMAFSEVTWRWRQRA